MDSVRDLIDYANREYNGSLGRKYDSPMAVILDNFWLSGDSGDDEWFGASGESFVRYGRRILSTTSHGFIGYHRFRTETEAIEVMEGLDDNE